MNEAERELVRAAIALNDAVAKGIPEIEGLMQALGKQLRGGTDLNTAYGRVANLIYGPHGPERESGIPDLRAARRRMEAAIAEAKAQGVEP